VSSGFSFLSSKSDLKRCSLLDNAANHRDSVAVGIGEVDRFLINLRLFVNVVLGVSVVDRDGST